MLHGYIHWEFGFADMTSRCERYDYVGVTHNANMGVHWCYVQCMKFGGVCCYVCEVVMYFEGF